MNGTCADHEWGLPRCVMSGLMQGVLGQSWFTKVFWVRGTLIHAFERLHAKALPGSGQESVAFLEKDFCLPAQEMCEEQQPTATNKREHYSLQTNQSRDGKHSNREAAQNAQGMILPAAARK